MGSVAQPSPKDTVLWLLAHRAALPTSPSNPATHGSVALGGSRANWLSQV